MVIEIDECFVRASLLFSREEEMQWKPLSVSKLRKMWWRRDQIQALGVIMDVKKNKNAHQTNVADKYSINEETGFD